MISEFLSSLFEPGIIFLIIFTFIAGAGIGFSYLSLAGSIVGVIVVMFFQAVIFFSVDYVDALLYIDMTGVSGGMAAKILNMHLVIHPVLLMLWIWFGRSSKKFEIQTRTAAAGKMQSKDFRLELDILGSAPELAVAGWFPARWNHMDNDQRLQWAENHIVDLRRIWVSGDADGFKEFGTELPAMMAAIDNDQYVTSGDAA